MTNKDWGMLINIGAIALGGATGCVVRYLVSIAIVERVGTSFPWGTLTVNIAGCLLIGMVARLVNLQPVIAEPWRLALAVGFLGGLTTFSTFGLEVFAFIQAGKTVLAMSYIMISNILGISAVIVGYWIMEWARPSM